MAKTESPVAEVEPEKRETALVGYQVAVDLWINEGQQEWAMFNGMLVGNSILIAAITLVITAVLGQYLDSKLSTATSTLQSLAVFAILFMGLPQFSLFLSVLGLLLCGIWFAFERRTSQYSDYWVKCARELEERYLADTLNSISRGGTFAEGGTVTVEISGKPTEMRMSRWSRIIRGKAVPTWVTAVLAIIYVATFSLSFLLPLLSLLSVILS